MCVAGLNVSTQTCAHRWYKLVRSCHPANNLANCPEKLRLEGWETRNGDCPWCDSEEATLPESTHRLFGSSSSSSSSISSSPTSPVASTRASLGGSGGTLTSLSALSRQDSVMSTGSAKGQRQREMNERLHLYLTAHPHEVLPSAAKNYPTYFPSSSRPQAASQSEGRIFQRTNSAFGKQFKKSVRIGKTMFMA